MTIRTIAIATAVWAATGLVACDQGNPQQNLEASEKAPAEPAPEKVDAGAQEEAPKADSLLPFEATGPVAIVNDEPVEAERFNREAKRLSKLAMHISPEALRKYRDQTIDRLIDETLVMQALAKEKIEADPAEVDAVFEKFMKNFRTEEEAAQFYERAGTSPEEVRAEMERSVKVKALLKKKYGVEVTEEEAEKFYKDNTDRFKKAEEVRASHILLKVDQNADEETRKKRKQEAQKLARKAREPEADFAKLAEEHSEGPTAKKGGDLGYFARKRMVPKFAEAAFRLEPGEVSNPVLTEYGYHVIKLVDKKPERVEPLEEVKNTIIEDLERKELRDAMRRFMTDIKKDAQIDRLDEKNIVESEAFKEARAQQAQQGGPEIQSPPTLSPNTRKIDPASPAEPTKPAE